MPSRCFNGWSFPTGCFVRTSIALMNLSPISVWSEYAKSRAVVFFGSRKQSGRMLPFESASFEPAGNIAMYSRRSNTDLSRTSWTPVEPNLFRTFFCINSSASFCFSFILSSFILKVDSPWIYSISSAFAAWRRESSASAEHGIIFISGNASFNLLKFFSAFGLSALFAAIIIGFVEWRKVFVKLWRSSFVHAVGFVGSSFSFARTWLTSASVTRRPENCFATDFAKSVFVDWIVRDSFSQTFSKIDAYHRFSSPSSISTSAIGSPCPSCPSVFVVAEMSTIWMNMSACRRLSRN